MIKALIASFLFSVSLFGQVQVGKPVQIMISGVPNEEKVRIDGVYPVSGTGTINMPYINTVQAAGMRPEDLAISLQNRYKSQGIFTNPTIQVVATAEGGNINQQSVTVGGQVRRPGPVPYTQDLTLWMAVQAAGGPTEFGAPKRVKLFRGGKEKSYDTTQVQFMRIPLQPNDTVEVPEKNIFGR